MIDFSYKEDALKIYYDIESTPNAFTLAMIHNNAMNLMFYGDEQFDETLTNEELIQNLNIFKKKDSVLKFLTNKNADSIETNVYRYYPNDKDSIERLYKDLTKIVLCKPLETDEKYVNQKHRFCEYNSWNGSGYDLPLMIFIKLMISKLSIDVTPLKIRQLSNMVIKLNRIKDWQKRDEFILKNTGGLVQPNAYRQTFNMSLWADGHIDWAILSKGVDENGTAEDDKLPSPLKREGAKLGMDVTMDESVVEDTPKTWTKKDKDDLIDYNFNDVLILKVIAELNKYALDVKDIVREMYPYTSAKSVPVEKLAKWNPPARDITDANLAALALVGANRIKPVDYPYVKYDFPLPDGKGGFINRDLLDYICEKEKFIHPFMKQFFEYFRGKNTSKYEDYLKTVYNQPLTHSALINIPYYRDGKPIDSYIRVSNGGAHGAVMAGLSKMAEDEISRWILSDVGAKDNEKVTVDAKNVLHIDFTSYYPFLILKMGIFMTAEGVDRYKDMIYKRVSIKKDIPLDKAIWTKEHIKANLMQLGLKLMLNSPTGKANTHSEKSLLPLDNKILSMRLIGNLHIWVLAQRLAQEGAFIISTNTDGLYICNMSEDKAKEVVNGYIADYGMDVEPELMSRLINRDVSNRIEFVNGHIVGIGGDLAAGNMNFKMKPTLLGKNIKYPLAVLDTALRYMEQEDWLIKPYDRSFVENHLEELRCNDDLTNNIWSQVYVGTRARYLTQNSNKCQKINRVMLTTDGDLLGNKLLSLLSNDEIMTITKEIKNVKNNITEIPLTNFFDNDLFNQQINDISKLCWIEQKTASNRQKYWSKLPYKVEEGKMPISQKHRLGYYNKELEEFVPIKVWKEGKISGYPNNIGVLCNTLHELETFDKNSLDMASYVRWVEQILESWKVTNDLEEIGLIKCDDTVIERMKKKRITNEEKNRLFLDELYQDIFSDLTKVNSY